MPLPIIVVAYVGAAIILGILGRNRKFGPWGYFFSSILFTPVIGVFLLLASDPRPRAN
ncbi:MAG: hypothetical protein HC888_11450 [Candidatus Competibacteraceae bacterium]|nr:hypothetical protein [Candidatus Competibacteraceae bacterium]